jgi:hypothetical protein
LSFLNRSKDKKKDRPEVKLGIEMLTLDTRTGEWKSTKFENLEEAKSHF